MRRTLKHRGSLVAWPLAVISLCAIMVPPVGDQPVVAQSASCRTTTANGDVQGVLRAGACAYLGRAVRGAADRESSLAPAAAARAMGARNAERDHGAADLCPRYTNGSECQ